MLRICESPSNKRPSSEEPFTLGVNYWPTQLGLDFWSKFDVDIVHEDFARLSDLGIKYARLFLPWEDFQANPDTVRCGALSHLMNACDAAAAEAVKLELVLCSSGIGEITRSPSWLPQPDEATSWPDQVDQALLLQNPVARHAARRLVGALARAAGGHPAVAAYNLGSYTGEFAAASARHAAKLWFSELAAAIREGDSTHPIIATVGHSNLSSTSALRIDEICAAVDRCSIDDTDLALPLPFTNAGRARFACSIASELCGKPCLLQKLHPAFSMNAREGSALEQATASYVEELLPALQQGGASGAILFWLFDRQPSAQSSPRGQHYGLLDEFGKLRPHGKVMRDFARTKPRIMSVAPPQRFLQMGIDEYYGAPNANLAAAWERFTNSG